MTARPTSWLVPFWPLRVITQGLIGLSNWILPGKDITKGGPFVSEHELLGSSPKRPRTRSSSTRSASSSRASSSSATP